MSTWNCSACLILGALLGAESAVAQTYSSNMVQAGPEYRVSGFEEFWLGRNWRDLWTAKIRVPVLDLGTFAGGLTPLREGGNQTITLRFHGANGRTYTFRSIDKDVQRALPPDIRHTLVASLLQD